MLCARACFVRASPQEGRTARSSEPTAASRNRGRDPRNLFIDQLLFRARSACRYRAAAPQPGALPTQRIEPRFRLLDSAGFSLCVEIACLRRVAACPIGSPFGKNEWVIGLREREACLSAACLGGVFEHNPRRANI